MQFDIYRFKHKLYKGTQPTAERGTQFPEIIPCTSILHYNINHYVYLCDGTH